MLPPGIESSTHRPGRARSRTVHLFRRTRSQSMLRPGRHSIAGNAGLHIFIKTFKHDGPGATHVDAQHARQHLGVRQRSLPRVHQAWRFLSSTAAITSWSGEPRAYSVYCLREFHQGCAGSCEAIARKDRPAVADPVRPACIVSLRTPRACRGRKLSWCSLLPGFRSAKPPTNSMNVTSSFWSARNNGSHRPQSPRGFAYTIGTRSRCGPTRRFRRGRRVLSR